MEKEFDEEMMKRVEQAAYKGAKDGSKGGRGGVGMLLVVIVLAALMLGFVISSKFTNFKNDVVSQLTVNELGEDELKLDGNKVTGFTTADFAEAVLGKSTDLSVLEVYEQKVSDAVTVTDNGLFNLKFLEKYQIVTFNGTATYVVDLSDLTENSITLDEESMTITITVPHATLKSINIPSDEIEFADVEKGFLGFGDLKLTLEQQAEIETQAEEEMQEELDEMDIISEADEAAERVIWKLFKSAIEGVASGYDLEIAFEDAQ